MPDLQEQGILNSLHCKEMRIAIPRARLNTEFPYYNSSLIAGTRFINLDGYIWKRRASNAYLLPMR